MQFHCIRIGSSKRFQWKQIPHKTNKTLLKNKHSFTGTTHNAFSMQTMYKLVDSNDKNVMFCCHKAHKMQPDSNQETGLQNNYDLSIFMVPHQGAGIDKLFGTRTMWYVLVFDSLGCLS